MAWRERQIVNLCVFHLYLDKILRESPSYQSIRGEFSVCCAGGERDGCHGRHAHTKEYTHTNVHLCEVILLHLCVFHLYHDMILREFPSQQSIRGEFPFVAPGASATGTMVSTHTHRSIHAPRTFV